MWICEYMTDLKRTNIFWKKFNIETIKYRRYVQLTFVVKRMSCFGRKLDNLNQWYRCNNHFNSFQAIFLLYSIYRSLCFCIFSKQTVRNNLIRWHCVYQNVVTYPKVCTNPIARITYNTQTILLFFIEKPRKDGD